MEKGRKKRKEEKKLELCWTQHKKKKDKTNIFFFWKIDSALIEQKKNRTFV